MRFLRWNKGENRFAEDADPASPIEQYPHCDSRVLHAPGECEFCDTHPIWQELRRAWGIAFTGHQPRASLPVCGRECMWGDDSKWTCLQAAGHEKAAPGKLATLHAPTPEWEATPCPADAARPPGADNDHRRWGGNKPTTADGDPAWPTESLASRVMYGDKGGRA